MFAGSILMLVGLSLAQSQAVRVATADRPALESVVGLARDAILTLGDAGLARDVLSRIKLTGDPVVDGFTTMTAKRQALARISEGRGRMSQYQQSTREASKLTGDAFDAAFMALEGVWLRSISLDERLLKAKTKDDLVAFVPDASKNAADAEEAWRMLPLAVVALTFSLVDESRTVGGKIRYLRITSLERAELIASVNEMLPKSLRNRKGDQHVVEASARILREWLMRGWKASDES